MKTRFSIDVPTGVVSRSVQGQSVPTEKVGILTARDVLDCEVVFTAGAEDITTTVLAEGVDLKLGLRKSTSEGPLLAVSAPHTMEDGIAHCILDLNTSEIVALVDSIPNGGTRSVRVYFEAEVSKADGSYRETLCQEAFFVRFEVNMQGDEPPAAAEESAQIATTKAAEASGFADDAAAARDLAQEWAAKTDEQVAETDFSAKEFAQGSQAGTGGSAKNWAQQTGEDVTGAAAGSRSSKSWAQDDLTPDGAALGGSAKDWAQSESLPDGVSKSAKKYAQDAGQSATAAQNSALVASAVGVSLVNPYLASKAPRPGIVSSGASYVGTTADNAALALGAGPKLWLRATIARPSHGTLKYVATKFAGNLGWKWEWDGSDILRLRVGNGSNFTTLAFAATQATGLPVNSFVVLDLLADFGAGTLEFYVNATKLGSTVNIAAATAQSLDSTGALYWGSDGTTHFVGTWSECLMAKTALPTASQLADFHRAGAVAPFCSWTTNTTTGQQVPTLGSIAFVAWPDFGRADPVNNPIAQDRSGNNQHAILGTSGLTAAVPLTWRNTAPASVIVSDGSIGPTIRNTLNNQNPGTGDCLPLWEGIYPQDTSGSGRTLMALTSSTGTVPQAKSLWVFYYSPGLEIRLYGATTSDHRAKISAALHSQLVALGARGIWTSLQVRRNVSGLSILLGIGADATRYYDVTNLFTESTNGTPPAWTDEINGTYLLGFYGTASAGSAQSLSNLALLNYAPTEAELRSAYARGWIVPEWAGASNTPIYTSDFSAGVDGFVGNNGTATGNVDGIGGQDNVLSFTPNTTNALHLCSRGSSLRLNRRETIALQVYIPASNLLTDSVRVRGNSGTGFHSGVFTPPRDTWTTISVGGIGDDTTLRVDACSGTAISYAGNGTDVVYFRAIAVTAEGFTTRLLASQAAGLTAPNAEAANGSSDFLLSSSGVSTPPENRRQPIRPGTLTFTSPGTLNLQLFGSAVVDTTKKWRIVSVSGTANGSANLSLGSASGGAQYISAQAVTSGDFDLGTFASRRLSGANLWLKSDATVTITDLVVILEQVN